MQRRKNQLEQRDRDKSEEGDMREREGDGVGERHVRALGQNLGATV